MISHPKLAEPIRGGSAQLTELLDLWSQIQFLSEHIGRELSRPMPDANRIAGEMAEWKALEQEMGKRFPILQRPVGPIK